MAEWLPLVGQSLALLVAMLGVWRSLDGRLTALEKADATRAAVREERHRRELAAGNDVLRQIVAQQVGLASDLREASGVFRIPEPPEPRKKK